MKILTVIPLQKNPFTEELTYFSSKNIEIGNIVSISIRNKKMLGLVVSSTMASEAKSEIKDMNFNLKKVIESKEISIFKTEFIDSVLRTSQYFISNKNYAFTTLIPTIIKEKYDEIAKFKNTTTDSKNLQATSSTNLKTQKLLFQTSLEERISYYKTFIRESFANKKSVYIVLPRELDIENFEEKLKKGIENFIVSIHSGLSPKNTLSKIEKIMTIEHPVLILGTAPFLSLPRHDIETIILERESDNAYKTISNQPLDLRVFVEIFASKMGVKLILADDLLSFETIGRQNLDNLEELRPLSFRVNFEGKIKILEKNKKEIINADTLEKKINPEKRKFKILTNESIEEIKNTLSKNENVFIFSLRKGLATSTVCKDCGEEVSCEECLSPLVLYIAKDGKKRMYVCNKCKTEKQSMTTCKYCDSWNLMPLGIGTDTVFEEIIKNFPKNKIFKLDSEVAKNSKTAKKIVAEFENTTGNILIGTEMAFFYLKEKVALSLISSFDSLWSIPNFKMSEKILHIVLNTINKTKNSLIIETKNINDSGINAIKNGNYLEYIQGELGDRRKLGYPPYKRFIKITCTGNKEEALKTREYLRELFKDYNPSIFGGFLTKSKNTYITNALIKIDISNWPVFENNLKSKIHQDISSRLNSLSFSFYKKIDPEDLL